MGKPKLTYEVVEAAAKAIKKRGEEPSITSLSEELGLLYEDAQLSSLLEQWYHHQPEYQCLIQAPLTDNIKLHPLHDTKTGKDIILRYDELEKSLSLLRATLECTADGIMMVNGQGQVVDWNQKFVEMWRIPSHMLESGIEKVGFEYILSQLKDPNAVVADVQYLYANPDWQGELPVIHFKDGRIFERFTQPQRVGEEIVGRVYSFRDVTQKRIADDELRIRERAIEASTHGTVIIDISKDKQPVIYVNTAFENITKYHESKIIGNRLHHSLGISIDNVEIKRLELAIREDREETVQVECLTKEGKSYWAELSIAPVKDSFNKVRHYVCIINDITERREMEKQLLRQATHDSLTELPNRVLLMDRVEQAILQSRKSKSMMAFLFLDLDRFKMTNDSLGHSIGDKLLQAVSNRLLIATNDFDTVARLGGDEFVVLLPNIMNEEYALQKAQEILTVLEKPFHIDQHSLKITGSVGVSFYPKDGMDYETLMKSADLSMYHAKDSGRNAFRVYEPEMNQRVISHMQLDGALREAMKRQEFYLHYQPLINLKTNTVVGVEALIRWNSHFLGQVSPLEFIGLAEDNGLIIDIGAWVLEEACRETVKLHKKGYKGLTVAVNLSGRQFRQTQLPEFVASVLKKTGLPAKCLELELTESLLVENIETAVQTMYAFKDMGVKLVIDDFGTGYSSLSYLKQFPVDKLKIDRSFIMELAKNDNDAAITKAIINLGHTLNLSVLAEGVETEYQKQFIIENGCDYAQGYFFQRPIDIEKLEEFLENGLSD